MRRVPDLAAALTALAECSPRLQSEVGGQTQQLLQHVEGGIVYSSLLYDIVTIHIGATWLLELYICYRCYTNTMLHTIDIQIRYI